MSKDKSPLVSVCVMTYQQVKFIVKCLDSILMQKTDFHFEILLGEDESTDGTREICKEYAEKYPAKIRLFLRSRKDVFYFNGHPTGQNNFLNNLRNAKGTYIAFCEGDDYWTDPYKLQKQVDFLEANSEYAGCFHDARVVDADDNITKENYYIPKLNTYNQVQALEMAAAYATCTLVFRAKVIENMPQWFLKRTADQSLDLLITKHGLLAHIPENMGAYRIHKGGIWQGKKTIDNHKQVLQRFFIYYKAKELRNKYKEYLQTHIRQFSHVIASYYAKQKSKKRFYYIWIYYRYNPKKNISLIKYITAHLLFPNLYRKYWKKSSK